MSKTTTKSARGEDCTVRMPGVCNFDPATTVFAHISGVRFGHGMSIKTNLGAYACSACHDVIDGRVKRPDGMTKQDVTMAHYEAVFETIGKLVDKGVLK